MTDYITLRKKLKRDNLWVTIMLFTSQQESLRLVVWKIVLLAAISPIYLCHILKFDVWSCEVILSNYQFLICLGVSSFVFYVSASLTHPSYCIFPTFHFKPYLDLCVTKLYLLFILTVVGSFAVYFFYFIYQNVLKLALSPIISIAAKVDRTVF